MDKDIAILVVTHNHREYIDKLLYSLIRFNYSNVYFCDAKSTDGTKNILLNSKYKSNLLCKNKLENFSKNNNDLIRHFKLHDKHILLLNPDTYFEEDFLRNLTLKIRKVPEVGVVTPLVKYPDNRIQVTWKKFPRISHVLSKRLGWKIIEKELQMKGPEIDWCLGACMLIHNRLFEEGGKLLDERYRLYCEDIDICFKAHTRGLKVLGISDSIIFHHLNQKSATNIFSIYNFWNICSIFKFIIKWNSKYFQHLSNDRK